MARQKVELIKCDRCKRQFVKALGPQGQSSPSVGFRCEFKGKKWEFEDLCPTCDAAVTRLSEALSEWERELVEHIKPVDDIQAPPLQPTPNYKPPIPHSPAAAKK